MPSWRTAASRHPTVILLHPPYYSTTAILSFANNRPMEAINRPISNSFRPPFRALRSPIVRPPCSLPFSSVSCVSRGRGGGRLLFISAGIPPVAVVTYTEYRVWTELSLSLSFFFLLLFSSLFSLFGERDAQF